VKTSGKLRGKENSYPSFIHDNPSFKNASELSSHVDYDYGHAFERRMARKRRANDRLAVLQNVLLPFKANHQEQFSIRTQLWPFQILCCVPVILPAFCIPGMILAPQSAKCAEMAPYYFKGKY
jgi:hypothetical protein